MKTLPSFLIFLLVLTLSSVCQAQPDILWTQSYGGGDWEGGYDVQQTTDGGYIIVGRTASYGAGGFDIWLIKTNAVGDTIWTRTFGGCNDEDGYTVQQTNDGGYIIAGGTYSFGSDPADIYIIKTDASGNEEWSHTYNDGFAASYWCSHTCVQQTSDGGYIIAGQSQSWYTGTDARLIKTDALGIVQWSETYGGLDEDACCNVLQTDDGGFVVVGLRTASSGAENAWLFKTDDAGDTQWSNTYGGDESDYGFDVKQTNDGGYIVTGLTTSFGQTDADVYLFKTDDSGNQLWSRTYGGTEPDQGNSVCQTSDGGYIIAGNISFGELLKTDAEGDEQWSQSISGSIEYARQTADGGYIATGNYSGNVILIRLTSDTGVIDPNVLHPMPYSLLPAYPNPFNPTTIISFDLPVAGLVELSVFDTNGRRVRALSEAPLQPGHHTLTFDGTGLPSGIYFARLTTGEFQRTQKLVLMK